MRYAPIVTALVVVVLSGIAYGVWTDRWGISDDLARAVERVDRVPLNVGDWEGTDEIIPERHLAQGDILAYKSRRYVHRTKKTDLQFLLVCGQPRVISVHTPDVCYEGAGYGQVGPLEKYPVKSDTDQPLGEFQYGLFRRTEAGVPITLRIVWSFSPEGQWTAPDQPRLAFPRTHYGFPLDRFLYKIYVVRRLVKPDEPLDNSDPSVEFLKEMMPELQKALFPSSPPA